MFYKTLYYENELYIKKIQTFLEKTNIVPNTLRYYLLAFIHKSVVNEYRRFSQEHNERLEFLWDAVLELVITEQLFYDFPESSEGVLTDYRSNIVKMENLARIAKGISLDEYIVFWKWEEKSWGRNNPYLLANCLEAFIGALYIDKGLSDAKSFIKEYIYTDFEKNFSFYEKKDYKTLFQEFVQEKWNTTPVYKVLFESWPDHKKEFVSWVFVKDVEVGRGEGSSKQKSEEAAAYDAYCHKERVYHIFKSLQMH